MEKDYVTVSTFSSPIMTPDEHKLYWYCPWCWRCQLPGCEYHLPCHVVVEEAGGRVYDLVKRYPALIRIAQGWNE
jgi:hypothetical protein